MTIYAHASFDHQAPGNLAWETPSSRPVLSLRPQCLDRTRLT